MRNSVKTDSQQATGPKAAAGPRGDGPSDHAGELAHEALVLGLRSSKEQLGTCGSAAQHLAPPSAGFRSKSLLLPASVVMMDR